MNRALTFLIGVVVVVVVIFASLVLAYEFPESSHGLAAWVQAVGSILAIVGAYFIGERQASAAQRQFDANLRAREQVRRLAYVAIGRVAMDAANELKRPFEGNSSDPLLLSFTASPGRLLDAADALKQIPLHEVGSAEAISAIAGLRATLLSLNDRMCAMSDYLQSTGHQAGRYSATPVTSSHEMRGLIRHAELQFERLELALARPNP
ncbi:hypothetical protein AWB67_06542 [Caballeronia terrestris]|uniref:Uncharacterized protein n=1 Tax=Caballeronia terrestris TaxID=1226301 RepID=A0A158KSH3_9BURK|nr:hypothetical protein [Caballeronia terrestris]SAL83925.1 hypothetical protein AWB67_06542 [Caballeronia terrestris]